LSHSAAATTLYRRQFLPLPTTAAANTAATRFSQPPLPTACVASRYRQFQQLALPPAGGIACHPALTAVCLLDYPADYHAHAICPRVKSSLPDCSDAPIARFLA
jgi:hypothetical protein